MVLWKVRYLPIPAQTRNHSYVVSVLGNRWPYPHLKTVIDVMWYLSKDSPLSFQKSYSAYFILREKNKIVLFKSIESNLKIMFPARCLRNSETYRQSSELRVGIPHKHRGGKKYFNIQARLILSIVIQDHLVRVTPDCRDMF